MNPRISLALLLVAVLVVIAGFVIWINFGGSRFFSRSASRPTPIPQAAVVDVFRQAAQEAPEGTREACLREKLGPERYAAVRLSPQSLTAEEQFQTLSCPRE